MKPGLLALVLWGNLFASLGLTNLALLRDSWRLMAVAAFLSFQFSFLAILSIGPFTILLTCLQVGAAVAISRCYGGRGWLLSLGGGLAVWLLLVGSVLFLAWQSTRTAPALCDNRCGLARWFAEGE